MEELVETAHFNFLISYNGLQVGDSNFTDLKNETKWKIK